MSSEVKRYDYSVDSSGESITETPNGRFVLCSNYAALARECEALRAAADDAHGLLTIAYMDGYHEGHKTCTDHSVRVRIGAAIVEAKAQKRRAEAAEAKKAAEDVKQKKQEVKEATKEAVEKANGK